MSNQRLIGSKGCALGGSRAEPWPYFPPCFPRAGNGHEVSTLCFSPPLVIPAAEINEMLDRVGKSLDALTVELRREQIAPVN
jgi:hypothetical protein